MDTESFAIVFSGTGDNVKYFATTYGIDTAIHNVCSGDGDGCGIGYGLDTIGERWCRLQPGDGYGDGVFYGFAGDGDGKGLNGGYLGSGSGYSYE